MSDPASLPDLLSRRALVTRGTSILAAAGLGATATDAAAQAAPATATGPVVFDIRAFGARADGATDCAPAFARAVAACTSAGGGTVYVPPGTWSSGPFRLASHVVLHLDAGAVVLATPRLGDYPIDAVARSGESVRVGLLTTEGAENVAIVGRGTLDGNAAVFHDLRTPHDGGDYDRQYTRQKQAFMNPLAGLEEGPVAHGERPGNVVRFINCRNVRLEGVTLQNSPDWTLQFRGCEGVQVTGLFINSRATDRKIPNDDGMDYRECRNVRISGCNIDTGDDCMAFFSVEHVVVSNCTLAAKSAGIRVGYNEGDIRDCVFENITIDANCGIKMNVRGGGSIARVLFSNIVIRTRLVTGHWWGKGEPIHVSAVRMRKDGRLGTIRDVRFSNIVAESEAGILVYGCEESPIRGLRFDRVSVRIVESDRYASWGGNLDLRSALEPSQALFARDLPAFYARHVAGLHVDGFEVEWGETLPTFFTHALEVEDFSDLTVDGFSGRQAALASQHAAIELRRGRGVTIRNCRAQAGTGVFVALDNVTEPGLFTGNDASAAKVTITPSSAAFARSGNRG